MHLLAGHSKKRINNFYGNEGCGIHMDAWFTSFNIIAKEIWGGVWNNGKVLQVSFMINGVGFDAMCSIIWTHVHVHVHAVQELHVYMYINLNCKISQNNSFYKHCEAHV